MPPLESTTSFSSSTCLPPGAQTSWSFVTGTGERGGGLPAILKLPFSVAQPVGSAAGAVAPLGADVSAAPPPSAVLSALTLRTSTCSGGGRDRAQPANATTARPRTRTQYSLRIRCDLDFAERIHAGLDVHFDPPAGPGRHWCLAIDGHIGNELIAPNDKCVFPDRKILDQNLAVFV